MARDLAIDLGTANTLVYARGEGIVLNEPSVIALNSRNKEVLAMGRDAWQMIGRTPSYIVAVRPLRKGAITDFEVTQEMIRLLLKRVGVNRFNRPRVVICVPSAITAVERRAVIETPIKIGNVTHNIQLTLTNRDALGYRMLLGREAMQGRMLLDPEKSFTQGMHSEIEARQLYREDIANQEGGLKIAVLASNRELYSNKRLMDAGRERGHTMRFINIQHCYMNVSADEPEIHYRGGEILSQFDAVIPRIRPAITSYGCAVLRRSAADRPCRR